MLLVTDIKSGKSVIVQTTDRIGKRFTKKRIDLSPKAFAILAPLSQGIIQVKIKVLTNNALCDRIIIKRSKYDK
jgi:rare lipoprotein A (peptidoglycan hydrolase)